MNDAGSSILNADTTPVNFGVDDRFLVPASGFGDRASLWAAFAAPPCCTEPGLAEQLNSVKLSLQDQNLSTVETHLPIQGGLRTPWQCH